MRILATISDMARIGIILDLESGEEIAVPARPEFIDGTVGGRPPIRPFGITWSANEVFIVNNKQLLVFDKLFTYLRTLPTRLQVNTHQLAYWEGRVWAVSPWTNSLIGVHVDPSMAPVEFDILNQTITPYIQREGSADDDKWHFNSLLWANKSLFIAAHAFGGESFINRYDEATLQLNNTHHEVGSSVHGLALYKDELFWISTKTGEIRSNAGYCLPLTRSGYARGFAVTSQYFIVATSEFLARGKRHAGDSWVQVIDRQRDTVVREFHLVDTGSINDLRLLDEYDYAHAVEPLWTNP